MTGQSTDTVWEDRAAATARLAPHGVLRLYERAFSEFSAIALWNIRRFEMPSLDQAAAIARPLRQQGDMRARHLADELEAAVRAAV
jgi:hypothetical protein